MPEPATISPDAPPGSAEHTPGTEYLVSVATKLRQLCPEATDLLDQVSRAAWEQTDPALLDLLRLRVATLIGNDADPRRSTWVQAKDLSDEKIRCLPQWPYSDLFDQRDRDCLAFAEQFVMDVAAMSDDDAFAASRHFDASGFYAFVVALYLVDFGQRLEIVSRALLPDDGARGDTV